MTSMEEEMQPAFCHPPAEPARKKTTAAVRWLLGVGGVAAVLLLAMLTYKAAEAFNWESVLRVMRLGDAPSGAQDSVEAMLLEHCSTTGQPVQYASLSEAPTDLYGYPIRPRCMPERLTYLQGTVFSDELNTSVTHAFLGDEGMCIFSVLLLHGADRQLAHSYEQVPGDGEIWYLGGCEVFFYMNSDDATLSAFWTKDRVQYSLFGVLTKEEMKRVVEQTMTR